MSGGWWLALSEHYNSCGCNLDSVGKDLFTRPPRERGNGCFALWGEKERQGREQYEVNFG